MKILKHTEDEIHIELCLTQVEQMHEQLLNFPAAPCWWKGMIDGVWVTVSVVNNIGHE